MKLFFISRLLKTDSFCLLIQKNEHSQKVLNINCFELLCTNIFSLKWRFFFALTWLWSTYTTISTACFPNENDFYSILTSLIQPSPDPDLFNLTFNPRESKFLWAPTCRWKLYNKRKYKYKINHCYNLAPSFCVITETDQFRLLIRDIGLYDESCIRVELYRLYQAMVEHPPNPGRKLNLYKIFIRWVSESKSLSKTLFWKMEMLQRPGKIILKTKNFCKSSRGK